MSPVGKLSPNTGQPKLQTEHISGKNLLPSSLTFPFPDKKTGNRGRFTQKSLLSTFHSVYFAL
ncbi:hypothetical protein ED312_19760 [Sinomicrobium pectinilyticum]|uniref:Uncharacterized protein n=1 Tax=Sinomicrobium pectinilyticum TaxID=1084421 RepID=A0A3N0DR39_SINP1|nr:hypothetical protein ED312_19760 [Sinomicrobium pectinilyticum]